MSAVDDLTRCVECDEWIDPATQAHIVHEPTCPDEDWCVCETSYVHPSCCRVCRPPVIPGQVSLLEDVPVASTKALPKMVHP